MNPAEEKVLNTIKQYNMLKKGDTCVVGISGGADSVCLLTMLAGLKDVLDLNMICVHVNHMIRGAEADSDQSFVETYCGKLGIPLRVFNIPVEKIAEEQHLTVEEAGRMERYKAFARVGDETGQDYRIAVAHNCNDLCETVLLNMARGTGLAGVSGIPAVRDRVVRPLIDTTRHEIEEYLAEKGIAFVTDSTNLETIYARNKISHKVLPELEEVNDRAMEHIVKLADMAGMYTDFVKGYVDDLITANVVGDPTENRYFISLEDLKAQKELIQTLVIRELIGRVCGGLKDIGNNHVKEVMKLYSADSGAAISLPKGCKAYVSYGKLIFKGEEKAEVRNKDSRNIKKENHRGISKEDCLNVTEGGSFTCGISRVDISNPGEYFSPDGNFSVKVSIINVKNPEVNIDLTKKEYIKFLDYDRIQDSLILRTPEPGDRMVIRSDGAVKKLNRILSDRKIERTERNKVPVIACGPEIVWAVGIRIGENYKVTDNTSRIICLEYKEEKNR